MLALQTALVSDHLKKIARDTVFNYITTNDPKRDAERVRAALVHTLSNVLYNMELVDFRIQVDVGDSVRLGERDIPKDAKPGDLFETTGIVVSSDGDGHGVVFDPHAPELDPTQVRVRIDIKLFSLLEHLSIDFTIADTAY